MSKRKRDEVDEEVERITDRALRIKVSRLKAKIEQGNRTLASALKLAKGFERQKMGRRQKTAEKEPHTLLRLREEVIILKQLDCAETAKNYLFKQLARTKRISSSAAFVQKYGTEPHVEAPASTAEANVSARLFNSAPVKKVMPAIMDSIYQILNIDQDPASSADKKSNGMMDIPPSSGLQPPVDVHEVFLGFSDDEGVSVGLASEEDQDFDFAEARIVGSSDESSDGEAFDGQTSEDGVAGDDRGGQSFSDSPDSALSDESTSRRQPSKSTKNASIPSLTIGGYYSGSESEDDMANDDKGLALPDPRKNRRGQRARQKIAEMKYGKNAKHLQNQKEGQQAQWDSKRGAVETKNGRRVNAGKPAARNGSMGYSVRDATDTSIPQHKSLRKPAQEERPMHPSWEAAKKRKESTAPSIAFAGKKITFD